MTAIAPGMEYGPRRTRRGPWKWIKANLFGNWLDTLVTLLLVGLLLKTMSSLVNWGVLEAVGFQGSAEACAAGQGACWAAIGNNIYLFLFGTYPADERWRAAAALAIVLANFASFLVAWMWRWRVALPLYAASVVAIILLLTGGDLIGLKPVELDLAGGLLLTWFIAWVALPLSFPLAVVLALARQSTLRVISVLAGAYIDFMRGLPLIVVLFLAAVILPLVLESGAGVPKAVKAIIGITLFAAAYQAEVLRGGLQAIRKGQYEAADALGLTYWQLQTRIVLPQAFPLVIRPMAQQYIGSFKNTSLVSVIGLFELAGITTIVITRPEWTAVAIETYLVVGAIYVFFCLCISFMAAQLEKRIAVAVHNP